MNSKNLIKSANSKGALARAVLMYQRTLSHYANESNWGVKGDEIVWLGDDDPTYAAQVSLGKRKHDPKYFERNKPVSGNRTNESGDTSHETNNKNN